MRDILIKFTAILLIFILCIPCFTVHAEESLDARSAILIEANTGTVLYEMNADEALPPASVTKVMTLLLVMEAVDGGKISLQDNVTVSEKAASMGGSQIFLEVGEMMSVEDLIKSVVIASANDAALALAEHIYGSEEEFVKAMNSKAQELNMKNTYFENTNGLDDTTTKHLTSARDIAIMSAELIVKHPAILNYTTIWQDTVRNGEFTLSNTNKLVRFYPGANGLKTGSTSKAKFCISASAKRDGLQLIAVIMGSSTRDSRNAIAKQLFDYGFANYAYVESPAQNDIVTKLDFGVKDKLSCGYESFSYLSKKANGQKLEKEVILEKNLKAPINKGDVIGKVLYSINGETVGEGKIFALESVKKMGYSDLFKKILKIYFIN